MPLPPTHCTLLFVVPTLNALAAQNEDVVQLLLFAAARLRQAAPTPNVTATILSLDPDTQGWQQLADLFPKELLANLTVEVLPPPVTPNLALPSHKAAYDFFEYLKTQTFDEVHCLDQHGLLYYPTQAKALGLYCLSMLLAVHVTGSTVFRYEAEAQLLDDYQVLGDDLLERGGLERADVVYVHDRKAWAWYAGKIERQPTAQAVVDLAWGTEAPPGKATLSGAAGPPTAIAYFGPLSATGGLPLFCDAIQRLLPTLAKPVEILFVGAPQAIGGMDAVSYVRLRSAQWGLPVTIKRDLTLWDELTFLGERQALVVCNTTRCESLRTRLLTSAGLPVLQIKEVITPVPGQDHPICSPNPNRIAAALRQLLAVNAKWPLKPLINLPHLWSVTRPHLTPPATLTPAPPLALVQQAGPKVSVCVTHFRRPQKLRTALASLKAQTYRNFDVTVIDDGSPEPETQGELEKIRLEIEPLGWRLLVQENRYLGAARNYGASQTDGDYLLFMDDDNVAKPNELSLLVAVAQRTGSDLVTSFFDTFAADEELTRPEPPTLRLTPLGAADPALGILTNCFGDANALYARTLFDKLGGFTEDYGITHEDWEFFCRAALEGAKLVCVPEPLFWYRVDQHGMYRGPATQLHKYANLHRHIRPYLAKLPYHQAKLVQLTQGLTAELPVVTVGATTRAASPHQVRAAENRLPYARVAVIMRTKDRPLLLRRAVRSVLDQTFQDWLLVIVNDGGDPAGVELVLNTMERELASRVLVLHHPAPLGMQTAANAGITHCDSDFIVIHDDDDSWQPNFLARTVSYLDENGWTPNLGGVVTWANLVIEELGADGEIKIQQQAIFNDKLTSITLLDLASENRFPPISFLFHRAALAVVGPFQEQYGVLGDWDFHLRVLQRYHIAVIPEALANYHHRTQNTTGVYGNSVHAQIEIHRAKRAHLHNTVLRAELAGDQGMSLGHLLALGDLQKTLTEQQTQEFQRVRDALWSMEQRITYISDETYNFTQEFQRLHNANGSLTQKVNMVAEQTPGQAQRPRPRNLVHNGDFRLWPGPQRAVPDKTRQYSFSEICPGFVLCHEGTQSTYQVEQRQWITDGYQLPWGKSYLHLENAGNGQDEKWLRVECSIPTILALAGQTISLSAHWRMTGPQPWVVVGGRYDVGDGRSAPWPEQAFTLPNTFTRWTYSLRAPAIQPTVLTPGHQTRLWFRLPYAQPFVFDLTDLQVEIGPLSTEFESIEPFAQQRWWGTLWQGAKGILGTVAALAKPFKAVGAFGSAESWRVQKSQSLRSVAPKSAKQ